MANSRAKADPWVTGDKITAARIEQIDQGQADAMIIGVNGWGEVPSISIVESPVPHCPLFATGWESPILSEYAVARTTVNTAVTMQLAVFFPRGVTLSSVSLGVKGVTGGTLPGTMPTVGLYRMGASVYGTATLIGSVTSDTSASNGAFTVGHRITMSSLAHAIESSSHYVLEIVAPTGGGTLAGFVIYRPFFTGTTVQVRTA